MFSASAPASGLAARLPAPASSLAVPPPAACTSEAVDLSVGAAILEDPGPRAASADAASTHQIFIFSSLPLVYCSCFSAFWLYFAGVSCVRTRAWGQILSCTICCLYCCTLHEFVACFVLWNWIDVNINTINYGFNRRGFAQ